MTGCAVSNAGLGVPSPDRTAMPSLVTITRLPKKDALAIAPVLPGVWTTTRRDSISRSHTGSIVAWAMTNSSRDAGTPARKRSAARLSQSAQFGARSPAALELQELRMTSDCGLGLLLDFGQPQDGQSVQFLPRGEVACQPADLDLTLRAADAIAGEARGSQQCGRGHPEQQPPGDPTSTGTARTGDGRGSEHDRPKGAPSSAVTGPARLRQGIGQSLELRLSARLQQLID